MRSRRPGVPGVRAQDFREAIGDRIAPQVELCHAYQRPGTLREGIIDAPLAAINADDCYGRAATVRVEPTHEKWYGITCRRDMPGVRCAIARMCEGGAYPGTRWRQ